MVILLPCALISCCLWLEQTPPGYPSAPVTSGTSGTASDVAYQVASEDGPDIAWRRTASGWENRDAWQLTSRPLTASDLTSAVHPVIVGLLALLISLAALIGFEPEHGSAAGR